MSDDINQNIGKIVDKIQEALKTSLFKVVQENAKQSLRIVPKDTGALRKSQYTIGTSSDDEIVVETGYDKDRSLDYAVFVHEFFDLVQNPTTPGTQGKFLEIPMKELSQSLLKQVSRQLSTDIKKSK